MEMTPQQITEKGDGFEWPTLGLILLCIIIFLVTTKFADIVTLWVAVPLLAVFLALFSSLQHEVLHGHPFKNRHLNEALVFLPLGIFVPFRRFKDTHILHHQDENLTDPYDDPETNFHDPVIWDKTSPMMRFILTFNNTLFGRMLIGPMLGMLDFYRDDMKLVFKRNLSVVFAYALHIAGLLLVFWWVLQFSTLPIWSWLLAAYLALSLLKIRTFLEHRAHDDTGQRTVIVDDRGFLALLFLNNNFHALHHAKPKLAWYKIPAQFDNERDQIFNDNGNYVYKSYVEVFKMYFFKTKDQVPHPLWSSRNRMK